MSRVRRGLRAVRKRIKSYRYRRKDGRIIKVSEHTRTYKIKTKRLAKRIVKESTPYVVLYAVGELTKPRRYPYHYVELLSKDEAKRLAKKMGISGEIKIAYDFNPFYSPGEDKIYIYPRRRCCGSSRHIPAEVFAHELGHKKVYQLIDRYKVRGLLLLWAELLSLPTQKSDKRRTAISAIGVATRRKELLSPTLSELGIEGLASYYGYRGLKKVKGDINIEQKKIFLYPVTGRLQDVAKGAIAGIVVRSLYDELKSKEDTDDQKNSTWS